MENYFQTIHFEWINQNYVLSVDFGQDVTVSGRKGTVTTDKGNYIGVTFHDDRKKQSLPCHTTSEFVYLDTFTNPSKFKPSKSKQRYLDYLHSDSSLSFGEWLKCNGKAVV
jgi:hypothetical protein